MKKFTTLLFATVVALFCTKANAQEYVTSITPGSTYSFISCSNNFSGYYMYGTEEGVFINLDKNESDSTTHFMFETSAEPGWYYLKNVATGCYLQKMAVQSGVNFPISTEKYSADTTIVDYPAQMSPAITDTVRMIETDKWFILKGAGIYSNYVYADTARGILRAETPFNLGLEYAFQLVQNDTLYSLKSFTGKYVGLAGNSADDGTKIPLVETIDEAAKFTAELLDTLAGQIRFESDNSDQARFLHMQGADSVCYWTGSGVYSQFKVYYVDVTNHVEAVSDTTIVVTEAELFQVSIANGDQVWIKNTLGTHINMFYGSPNAEGDKGVTYWTGSGDASRWHILKVKDGGDNMVELAALLATVEDYISRMDSAGKLGYYSVDSYETLNYQYEEAKGVYEYEESTYDDVAITINILTDALNTFLDEGVVKPDEDKYYRIKNVVYGTYAAMTDTAGLMLEYNVNDPRTVWTFEPSEDGGFYIKNVWLGLPSINNNGGRLAANATGDASTWSLFNNTGNGLFQIHVLGAFRTVSGSNEYWAASDDILYNFSSIAESYWTIEECELPDYKYDDWTTHTLKVDGAQVARQVVGVKYYNLAGSQLGTLQKGLNIKRTVYSDGTVKAEKVFVK